MSATVVREPTKLVVWRSKEKGGFVFDPDDDCIKWFANGASEFALFFSYETLYIKASPTYEAFERNISTLFKEGWKFTKMVKREVPGLPTTMLIVLNHTKLDKIYPSDPIAHSVDYTTNGICFLLKPSCFQCRKNVTVSCCTGCKIAFYCSTECQKAHRKKHRSFCISRTGI